MSLTTAIIVAGVLVMIGLIGGLGLLGLFAYKIFCQLAVFKVAATAADAAMLNRSLRNKAPTPPSAAPDSEEPPNAGLNDLGNEARKEIRKKLNSTPVSDNSY